MVTFPPLAPSVGWFSDFIQAVVACEDRAKAIETANSKLLSPKEFGRFVLKDWRGEKRVQSLAVEGGGRQLRTFNKLSKLRLSEHGEWRKVHTGAIETILGRKPFYRDIEDRIRSVYSNMELKTLDEFNTAILEVMYTFLIGNLQPVELAKYSEFNVIKERGKEIADELDKEVTILEALASHGKETLLGILALGTD